MSDIFVYDGVLGKMKLEIKRADKFPDANYRGPISRLGWANGLEVLELDQHCDQEQTNITSENVTYGGYYGRIDFRITKVFNEQNNTSSLKFVELKQIPNFIKEY